MKRNRAADIAALLRAPDPAFRFILFHGEDEGLVRERADQVAATVVPDANDPFRIVKLTGAEILQDPARLADEAAAIAMGGGRRVIRLSQLTDRHTKPLLAYLAAPIGDALIVGTAGKLSKTGSLRKGIEAARNAVAVPCYPDEDEALETLVTAMLTTAGLTADDAAIAYLVDHLGGDRQLTRREIEKLILYVGPRGKDQPITREEVAASVGDTANLTYDDLCSAITGGDQAMVDRCLVRLEAEGESPVGILRIVSKHFQRVHSFHASVSKGRAPMDVANSMRIYGPRLTTFLAATRTWQGTILADAFRRLNEAEVRCKSTGYPDWTVVARTLSGMASIPRAARR